MVGFIEKGWDSDRLHQETNENSLSFRLDQISTSWLRTDIYRFSLGKIVYKTFRVFRIHFEMNQTCWKRFVWDPRQKVSQKKRSPDTLHFL